MKSAGISCDKLLQILFCILLTAIGCTGQNCPRKCVCELRIAVHCASKGITEIPEKLPFGTVQLMAENNDIKELPVNMLRNGKFLRTLVLHGNEITALSGRNFRSTPSLDYLDLSRNNISYIPGNTFFGLHDLHMLSLSMNEISRVSPLAFADLPTLRELFLSENNIRALPFELFRNLGSIENLHLDGNSISTVPDGLFRTLTSLVSLDLSRNRIRRIAIGTTRGLQSLQQLFLHSNQIGEIDGHFPPAELGCDAGVGKTSKSEVIRQSNEDGVFTNLRQLHTLDMRYNSLKTIRLASFIQLTQLRELKLEENIWSCDCSLKKTINKLRLSLNNQHLAWGEIHCTNPRTIRNINLDDLSLRDIESVISSTSTTKTTTTTTAGVYGWNNRNAIEKSPFSKWHGADDNNHAGRNQQKVPQIPKITPGLGEESGKGSVAQPSIISSTSASSGNRGVSSPRTLDDLGKASNDKSPGKEKGVLVPPNWSPNRAVGGVGTPTITSDPSRYHSNAGDDVSTRLFGNFPTAQNNPVKSRNGDGTMVTMETAEGRNWREGNESDTNSRDGNYVANDGKGTLDGVLKKKNGESPSRKEKSTETWMLACVIVLSIFAVVACASLTIQKHYQRNNKEWRCCFKKDNFHTSASIRSVTTYPLLYDNALARRPLPREPSFIRNSRSSQGEDVRWTNGGVYGLGSNRSSFISVQTSQTNLSNIGGITGRLPATKADLHGSRAPLLPPTPNHMNSGLMTERGRRISLGMPGTRDCVPLPTRRGWDRGVENFTLIPTSRVALQRSQSTAVPVSGRSLRPEPIRTRSDRGERHRRAPDERQRHRRKKRLARRPESAIIVPTLHEQDGEFGQIGDKKSDWTATPRDDTDRRRLRRRKSECRATERKATGLHEITEITEEVRSAAEANPFNTTATRICPKTNKEFKPEYDALSRLDGLLAEHLAKSPSTNTLTSTDSGHQGSSGSKAAKCNQAPSKPTMYQPDLVKNCVAKMNTGKIIPDQRGNGLCPSPGSNFPAPSKIVSNILESQNGRKPTKPTPNVSYKNGGYDVLLLCTSGANPFESKPKNDGVKSPLTPKREESTVTNDSQGSHDKSGNPLKRRESSDSMFVDLESICESLITEDSGSCFGDVEGDFEIVYPTVDCYRTCPSDVYGSDQYILDSLRNQDKMVMRPLNHTSPGALEHMTVPLSELSSEGEDDEEDDDVEEDESFAVLQVQSFLSRTSSIGSISTVIDQPTTPKAPINDNDFVYTMAAESPMETVPKIVIEVTSPEKTSPRSGNQTPTNINAGKRESEEAHYHHIRDMYSGFPSRKPRESGMYTDAGMRRTRKEREEPLCGIQRQRRRPYEFIQTVHHAPALKNITQEKECKEPKSTKEPLEKNLNEREEKNKNLGYFETIESSDDGGSTDVEVFDLGTL